MLTKYITAVKTSFSPFNPRSGKTVRSFLALLPSNARSTMAIDVKMFGKAQAEAPATLAISFSRISLFQIRKTIPASIHFEL
jgi:large subunit ribosomal protein L53